MLLRRSAEEDWIGLDQSKTGRPVQFEVFEITRRSMLAWVASPAVLGCRFPFSSRFHDSSHISTRQYAVLFATGYR